MIGRVPVLAVLVGACAAPEPRPEVITPVETLSHALRLDVLPGLWPNVLPSTGEIELALIAEEDVDPTALSDVWIASWDLSEAIEVSPEVAHRDVDGDGRDDAVFRVDTATLRGGVLVAEAARVVVTGRLGDDEVSGWDVVLEAGAAHALLPEPTGPWAVGTVIGQHLSDERSDPLVEGDRARTVPLQFFYPADTPPGAQPGPVYLNRAEASVAAGWAGLDADHWDRVLGHAISGAPVAYTPPSEPFPTVLLAPGEGSLPFHAALAVELASRGVFVVGLNPPYSGLPVLLPDGTDATAPTIEGPVKVADVAAAWVGDAVELAAEAEGWAEDELPFRDRVTSAVGYAGVGLGGTVAAEICAAGTGVTACADVAGTPLDQTTEHGLTLPLLVVTTGGALHAEPAWAALLDRSLGRTWAADLPNAGPDSLHDLSLHGVLVDGRALDTGTAPPDETVIRLATVLEDFFRSELLGEEAAFLEAGGDDGVTVESWGANP